MTGMIMLTRRSERIFNWMCYTGMKTEVHHWNVLDSAFSSYWIVFHIKDLIHSPPFIYMYVIHLDLSHSLMPLIYAIH